MRRNEVDRQLFTFAKLQEFPDPNPAPLGVTEVLEMVGQRLVARLLLAAESVIRNKVARRGSAYFQAGIHRLYGGGRGAIQLEVFASGRVEEKPKVWLIPDFEIPLPDLSGAVAPEKMSDKFVHQGAPVTVVFGRRHMGLPPEAADVGFARQVFREEAKLEKRLHPIGQQGIDQIIDVLPVEYQGPVLPPAGEHVVVQQAMETQIAKSAAF